MARRGLYCSAKPNLLANCSQTHSWGLTSPGGLADYNVLVNLPDADHARVFEAFYGGDWEDLFDMTAELGLSAKQPELKALKVAGACVS